MKQRFVMIAAPDADSKMAADLARQWGKRAERLKAYIPYLATEMVRKAVQARIPNKQTYAAYKQSLETAAIVGVSPGEFAYCVRARIHSRRVRKIDVSKSLLYIRPRSKIGRVKPEILILEKYSPWTAAQLPFQPGKADAIVLTRKVNRRLVDQVSKKCARQRPRWRHALDKLGLHETKKKRLELPRKAKVLPDVVFEALRLEFGTGGTKARPHWRPAISGLVHGGISAMIRRHSGLKQAFTQPRFRGWKKWPPKTRNKVRIGEARSFMGFQKRLGIRAS